MARVVIDTCLSLASHPDDGWKNADAEKLLTVFWECRHVAVFAQQHYDEWMRVNCENTFAITWLSAMRSRNKAEIVDGVGPIELRRLGHRVRGDDRKALQNDLFLIGGALAGDRIILSRDEVARCFFGRMAWRCPAIEKISWINPSENFNEFHDWLKKARVRAKDSLKRVRCRRKHSDGCTFPR